MSEATAKQKPKTEFCFGESLSGSAKSWFYANKDSVNYLINARYRVDSVYSLDRVLFLSVINAVSRRYFLQANDVADMREWVAALNKASKITVSS